MDAHGLRSFPASRPARESETPRDGRSRFVTAHCLALGRPVSQQRWRRCLGVIKDAHYRDLRLGTALSAMLRDLAQTTRLPRDVGFGINLSKYQAIDRLADLSYC
jgi:hypothetical protein